MRETSFSTSPDEMEGQPPCCPEHGPDHSGHWCTIFKRHIRGEVRMDTVSRLAYATDASVYRFPPLLVVEPLDREDIEATVRLCAEHRMPLIPRGAGTSLVGQPVGAGVIMDVSRHCTRILEFNRDERWIRVEPGVVRDELNRYLQPFGLHFAPDPATTSRANIGGMIANNSSGMRSIQYGMTIDHLLSLDLILADGTAITLGRQAPSGAQAARTAQLIESLAAIVDRERDEIKARYPKVERRSGGYALDALLEEPRNWAKLVAGSEGTLGVIVAATLNLEPLPAYSGVCLAHFSTLGECLRAVEPLVNLGPSAVELMDGLIVRMAREHPLTRKTCDMIEGEPAAVLVVEARSDDAAEVQARLDRIQAWLKASGRCYAAPVMTEPGRVKEVWTMRESALGLMSTVQGIRRPIPYIEDAAVPLASLADYVEEVLAVCERHGQPVSLFAHAGAGLLHIRPMHDLRDPDDRHIMLAIQDEVFALVQKYGGSWSGEHGDGIIRGHYNRAFFGDRLYAAFREIKQLFDPEGRLNPGKVLDTPPRDQNLRVDTGPKEPPPVTRFRWKNEGSLANAAAQCTGVGACRQIKSGVMCPSYMATRDEVHSTRGRANVLREALSGALGPDAMTRDDVMAVFDLCLSCKGCKSECPNKVDVGKMKAELQYQYYQNHRRPLRDHVLARTALLGRLHAGWRAPIANTLLSNPLMRWALDRWLGIDARRPLPLYTRERLSAARSRTGSSDMADVLLFHDSYIEYHDPEIGHAAIRLLERCGYTVALSAPEDSQRPALSLGLLDRARHRGACLLQRLLPYAAAGKPILVVEPSCATALRDELPDLVDDHEAAATVARHVTSLTEFLAREKESGAWSWPPAIGPEATVFYHPHCHQRSLDQGRGVRALLQALPGVNVLHSTAGCCGMAGAFGYEKEHYDLSVKIAEDRLLPAIRALDQHVTILADGFSCRHQIADLSGRQARHPLEWIEAWINQAETANTLP